MIDCLRVEYLSHYFLFYLFMSFYPNRGDKSLQIKKKLKLTVNILNS